MPSEAALRPETTTQIVRLARFAILGTLAFGALLLLAELLFGTRGSTHFLTQQVVVSLVYAIAIEVVAATAAATCLALWRG